MSLGRKTINGHEVVTYPHRNHRVGSLTRKLCAALDRNHDAIDRVDGSPVAGEVTVWFDEANDRAWFDTPDRWRVVRMGVYGSNVAVDLEVLDDAE